MPDSIWRRYSWITPIRQYARHIRIGFCYLPAYLSIGDLSILPAEALRPDSIWRRYSWITPIRRYARSIRISFFDFSAYLSIGEFNIASEFSLVNEKLTFAAYDRIGGEASRCGALFLCLIRIIKSACVERVSWLVRVLQNTAISIKKSSKN